MTSGGMREQRRRQNGELLRVVDVIVYPYYALHLVSNRGRHVFDEFVRVVELGEPSLPECAR